MATVTQLRCASTTAGPSNTATRFTEFPMPEWTVFESSADGLTGLNCTVQNVVIHLEQAPGAGKSWTFQIRKSGANVAGASITIADTNKSGTYTGSFVMAPGENWTLQSTPSGTPTAFGDHTITWEQVSATSGESQYQSFTQGPSNSALNYQGVFSACAGGWHTTAASATNVVPLAGTVTQLRATLSAAPGAGKSWAFTIYLNGVKQDGTAGTPNTTVTIADAATSGSASFSLAVVPGDTVYLESSPTGTPTVGTQVITTAYYTATDGASFIMAFYDHSAQGLTVTRYHDSMMNTVNDGAGGWNSTTQTDGFASACGVTGYTLGPGMYAVISAAPGAGKSRTFTMHINGSAPSNPPQIVISGAGTTTGNDTTNKATVSTGQLFGINSAPSGTPASSLLSLSIAAKAGTVYFGTGAGQYIDWNTSAREYLRNFYGVTNQDLAPLLARWYQETPASLGQPSPPDLVNWYTMIEKRFRGQ